MAPIRAGPKQCLTSRPQLLHLLSESHRRRHRHRHRHCSLFFLFHLGILDSKRQPLRETDSASADDKTREEQVVSSSSSSLDIWKDRIIIPTVLAGIAGGRVGLIFKHRKTHALAQISATYAANFAIVSGCYCGAHEFVRVSRTGKPDDFLNSAIGGFGSGAILGRLQGGPIAAARYSVIFAFVGTTVDYAALKLKPFVQNFYGSLFGTNDKNRQWWKLPKWSPIQVLDEEALAAKRATEEQIYRNVHNLSKEES